MMAAMTFAIIILGTIAPLLPLVFAPARTIGRGGAMKYVGAAALVGVMLLIFFSVRDMGGSDGADLGALPSVSPADVSALANLFGGN